MLDTEILSRLQPVFRDTFDDEELVIQGDMSAGDIEDWDSLSNVRLMIAFEVEFDIRIKASEVVNLNSIDLLVELVASKL